MPQAYCVKCRASKAIKNPKEVVTKNNRLAVQGVCPDCGTKILRFLPKK